MPFLANLTTGLDGCLTLSSGEYANFIGATRELRLVRDFESD
jgi:hypothetical protein